jgi:polyisoprenoid-binding protein YceI
VSIAATEIPGYVVGRWVIDPIHSNVSFTVRHMMVSKVRGRFARFSGTIVTAEDWQESSVVAEIDMASVDTGVVDRDNDLRSASYFDVQTYPTMTYRSSGGVRRGDSDFVVEGDLSLHGVTRSVPLRLEFNGVTSDTKGGTLAGFSATAEINRRDFGIDLLLPLDGGGVVVAEKVKIALEIEAGLQAG